MKLKKPWVISVTLTAVIAFIAGYIFIPAITPRSGFTVLFILGAFLMFTLLFGFTKESIDDKKEYERYKKNVKYTKRLCKVFAVLCAITLAAALSSATCFHATKANEVANVAVKEATVTDFPDLAEEKNVTSLALIDLDSARMLGDKKIANIKHASWYEMDDEYDLIQFQGKYYRLSFIDYGGLWKYHKAKKEGIPGYILVECTPEGGVVTQNTQLVVLDKPIKYSEGAFWSHDLKRHLRSQYPTYIFDKSFAEIDDEGTPYYVTGVLKPQAGVWGVKTVESFILTNAQTGESEEYRVEETPKWIDHVFSLDYLTTIAEWHYALKDGWLNSKLSKTNVWHTSYFYREKRSTEEDGEFANFFGYSSVILDGDVQFYTGLTAANNAESNLGWLFMDTSTGQMTEYAVVGAEESSGQKAVEQLVSAYRYQATFPLPANIAGEATYIMVLKGDAGLVQAYAVCNVENHSIAVQAETLPKAISLYLAKLKGTAEPITESKTETTGEGNATASTVGFGTDNIVSVTPVDIDGTTQYIVETTDGSTYVVVKIK